MINHEGSTFCINFGHSGSRRPNGRRHEPSLLQIIFLRLDRHALLVPIAREYFTELFARNKPALIQPGSFTRHDQNGILNPKNRE